MVNVIEDCYMIIEQVKVKKKNKLQLIVMYMNIIYYNLIVQKKKLLIMLKNIYISNTLHDTGNNISENIYIVKHLQF